MKKIFIRSPYYIQVAETGQAGSKIEVFLWNYTDTEPTTPTYTLSKEIPSPSQIETSYNVANLAKDFIKITYPTIVTTPTIEEHTAWCYMKVKRYKLSGGVYTLLDTETIVCLNGYSTYEQGYNYSTTTQIVPLLKNWYNFYNPNNAYLYKDLSFYIDFWVEQDAYNEYSVKVEYYDKDFETISIVEIMPISGQEGVYKVPIIEDTYFLSVYGESAELSIFFEKVCEPKYTPKTVAFINRYGGWQFLTFFKASKESIDVTSTKFDLMPEDLNYNIKIGQTRTLNHNGKQKIRMNTGFVQESYFELMQDLLLSEVVLIDNKPATVKTNSLDYKKRLDGLINYEVEFEYSFNLIQNVR